MTRGQRRVRSVPRRRAGRLSAAVVVGAALALVATTVPAAAAGGGGSVHATASTYPDSEGIVLDAWGGLHVFTYGSTPAKITSFGGAPYWPGWDIARGVALRNTNLTTCTAFGGYTLDAWGGLHPFGVNGTTPPAVDPSTVSYWPGWQIVRSGTVFRNAAGVTNNLPNGGFTLDAWGGLHGFAFTGQTPPVTSGLHNAPYWSGWNIARGLVMRNIRTC